MVSKKNDFSLIKKSYDIRFEIIKSQFLKKHNSSSFLKQNTKLCDDVLKKLWLLADLDESFCLVAVGGYGRKELYPSSDIDITIITNSIDSINTNNVKLENFIQLCWDFGFKLGVSQRVINEIAKDIRDITIATNLLESRLICGNHLIYEKYNEKFKKTLNVRKFILAKVKEQELRHQKFSKSGYLLEPNIKESRGCLRDIHFIRWLCAAKYGDHSLKTLLESKVITKKQLNLINFHYNKLIKRRIYLHIATDHQEDRMLFDYQSKIAKDLGFKNSSNKKASEFVMNSLYKSIRYIILFNEIITKKFTVEFQSSKEKVEGFNELYISNGLLELCNSTKKDISKKIFAYFHLFQRNPSIQGFGPNLIDHFITTANLLIDKTYRSDKNIQKDFLQVFKEKQKVNRSLRLLNRYNILGKFLPVFGKIISQMQHDLFHIYTVDEHTLNVIDNLRRYSKAKLKHESPESYEAFKRLKDPSILYLAGLFHDIAKGRGGDHSSLGEKEVKRFGRTFNLSTPDIQTISWLVKNHLLMSNVAQKLDLADPSVIRSFANEVQNQDRLDLIYLLTTADIRGTSHKVWNQWKSVLINGLHQTTTKYLQNKLTNEQFIEQRVKQIQNNLIKYSIEPHMYHKNWSLMGSGYFTKFEAPEISWHTRLLLSHANTQKTITRVRHQKGGQGIEVLIYTKDKCDIFYKTCHFFNEISCEISQAKIFTTNHNYALNVFNVTYEDESSLRFKDFFKYIEENLTNVIDQDVSKNSFNTSNNLMKKSRQASFHQIEDFIELINDDGLFHLQIKTANRKALLLSVASLLKKYNISLSNAKITTMGERVEDHFDFKISNDSQFEPKNLENDLLNLLQ